VIYTRKSCEERLELEFNSLHAQRESAEAAFPQIPIAEIDSEKEWVLDDNRWGRVQLHHKDEPKV
jgi:hypothetical protein